MGAQSRVISGVLAVVCCAGAAACGGSDNDDAAGGGSNETTAAATALPTAAPATIQATPIGPRVQARFDMPGEPDGLVVTAGSLWVIKATGTVVRIDPATNTEIASIPGGPQGEGCQGFGASESAVWSCLGDGIVRIDPATNAVVATLPIVKTFDQVHLPFMSDRVWVLTGDGSTLTGIADDAVDSEIQLGARCTDLAGTDTEIWAICPFTAEVVRVDVNASEVTARVAGFEDVRRIAAGDAIWVGFRGGVARINPESAEVTGVADAAPGTQGDIAAMPEAVWVRAEGRFLRRIDPETLDVLEELSAPEASGGAVLEAYGSLWATAYNDNVMYRLTPQ